MLGHSSNFHIKQQINHTFQKFLAFKFSLIAVSSRAGVLKYGDEAPMPETRSGFLPSFLPHEWILSNDFLDRESVSGASSTEWSDVDGDTPLFELLPRLSSQVIPRGRFYNLSSFHL